MAGSLFKELLKYENAFRHTHTCIHILCVPFRLKKILERRLSSRLEATVFHHLLLMFSLNINKVSLRVFTVWLMFGGQF